MMRLANSDIPENRGKTARVGELIGKIGDDSKK